MMQGPTEIPDVPEVPDRTPSYEPISPSFPEPEPAEIPESEPADLPESEPVKRED